MEGSAWAQDRAAACASVHEHASDTVLVFEPPGTFTVCRGGSVQPDVVTGRPLYLQVTPSPGSSMFDFRVHGQASAWAHTGLGTWEDQTKRVASDLRDLEHAAVPIGDIPVPLDVPSGSGSPLRPLAAARTRYASDVTARFLDALHAVRGEARELPIIASVVRRWCGELATQTPARPAVEAEFRAQCNAPELQAGNVDRQLAAFEGQATLFDRARDHARDALVAAVARPEDAVAGGEAVKSLDEARRLAAGVIAAAHDLREASWGLSRAVAELRVTVRSIDALRPSTPTYLATYASAGNAELEIDATPVDIASAGSGAQASVGKTTARFPVVDRHYVDFEAGLGLTGGTPQIPYVENVQSVATIQGKPMDSLVGLALLELEPGRFLWPDRPLAGLFRFPVIGLPFTRNPTQNFFTGAGLGWTGVGSLVAGPYLAYQLTLRDGYSFEQALPAGTTVQAATQQQLRVGYFASASVDLVGLFRLFVPAHGASIDAATGKEK
jgi:hypothetical protein